MTDSLHIGHGPQPAPEPTRRPVDKRQLITGLVATLVVGAVVLGGGLVAYLLLAPGAITVNGHIDLTHRETQRASCVGQGGYSDIGGGAQVVVSDAAGKTIAIGHLNAGQAIADVCRYYFVVKGVPGGMDFYGVEITHRGRVQFTRAQLDQAIKLTLG